MAGIMMPEEREHVRRVIAACIDYPSMYMGGPSQNSLRKASAIMDALDRAGRLQPTACEHDEWVNYKQHGTHCPTCGMKCYAEK